jgi:hypothetical protein
MKVFISLSNVDFSKSYFSHVLFQHHRFISIVITENRFNFNQFDLIVFGDGIASPSHGDHLNTQTIIQSLDSLGKLSFGYVDLGVTTQNLSISLMQITVNNWTLMGVKGIMFDDAG